ncbi:MAG: PIN domain-containing protein [Imperialibacter sp.]
MKVIVDANIVFSAILNTNGKIGYLLLNSTSLIEYVAPEYMIYEVKKYFSKIEKNTNKPFDEIERIYASTIKNVQLISESEIPFQHWITAEEIVSGIDPKDTPYVAFADFRGVKIWTGDKALRAGLTKKGYDITITTDDLYEFQKRSFLK